MINRKKLAYLLIIASVILLVLNLCEFDFNNLKNNKYSGVVSNLLLILAMVFTIRDINKKDHNNKQNK